ncbi:MAG: ribosome assembly factor SBDS [Candidatus Thermoplasmatota archaeon]|nr:ribosome assembly factor SBDS [Candidatus Thermoplasmatota archaeon]MDI6855402.1 ribosome assembly factor SBDS [Candidatus Thermoplasmatota archaeon]
MVRLEDSVIARYEAKGEKFEILIAPEAAQKLRNNESVNILENLVIDTVFRDSSKGTRASEESLAKIFGTTDIEKVAREIVLKGELQITTEQRRKMIETKRKEIIATIARNAIDPRTNLPHPIQRIELAFEQAKVRIDPFKATEVQLKDVLDALKPILPIRFEKITVEIKVEAASYGKIYNYIKASGAIKKEEWTKDGFLICHIEIPAGLQTEFYDKLNQFTKGNIETKIIK